MSVDHLYFAWWMDGEGHPWVWHDCVSLEHGETDSLEWRLPPPWHLNEEGGISPSLNCQRCGKHVILSASDKVGHAPL